MDVAKYSEQAEQLKVHLQATPEGKFYLRVNCVYQALTGRSKGEICRDYGMCRETLYVWINDFLDFGIDALVAIKQTGRQRVLTDEQCVKIDEVIAQSPLMFGYKQSIWEGKLLVDYIANEFKITVSVRTAQRLIKQLGYTLQRPRTMPAGSDEEQRNAFKQT